MAKLQRYDLVKGTPESNEIFCITNEYMTGQIVQLRGNIANVKIIKHKTLKEEIGMTYDVNVKYLEKVEF